MTLTSETSQKLILLAATAALSGFLVPYVLKRIELQRAQYEKDSDAAAARQEKLISAQSTFLDALTEVVWKWRFIVVRVTYYGGQNDMDRYESASKSYADDFWEVASAFRVELSKSYRLVSPEILERLKVLYRGIVDIDKSLMAIKSEVDLIKRQILYMDLNHQLLSAVSDDIDQLLQATAKDLGLAKEIS